MSVFLQIIKRDASYCLICICSLQQKTTLYLFIYLFIARWGFRFFRFSILKDFEGMTIKKFKSFHSIVSQNEIKHSVWNHMSRSAKRKMFILTYTQYVQNVFMYVFVFCDFIFCFVADLILFDTSLCLPSLSLALSFSFSYSCFFFDFIIYSLLICSPDREGGIRRSIKYVRWIWINSNMLNTLENIIHAWTHHHQQQHQPAFVCLLPCIY